MENLTKILEEISFELTNEMKRIIKAGGHIRTGLMYNNTFIECAYNPLANKQSFVFTVDSPYYFQYVNGNFGLIKQLIDSEVYKSCKEKFKDAVNKTLDTSQNARSLKEQVGGFLKAAIKEKILQKLLKK